MHIAYVNPANKSRCTNLQDDALKALAKFISVYLKDLKNLDLCFSK